MRSFALRRRIAALVAVAVFAAVLMVSLAAWLLTRSQLRTQTDSALIGQATAVSQGPLVDPGRYDTTLAALSLPFQLVDANGTPRKPPNQQLSLPVNAGDVAVARGQRSQILRDVTVNGDHLRLVTTPYASGIALQVATDLSGQDRALHRLAVVLLLASLGGAAVAAAVGVGVARTGLAPVRDLTAAAERVARTDDLSAPLPIQGGEPDNDEVARLAASFNTMLAALATSRERQQQLVADAGHELRTPLTSLRTNLELLAREDPVTGRVLAPGDRKLLLADLTAQTEELSTLVGDLTALARDEGGARHEEPQQLDLADVVQRAVARTRRRAPEVRVITELASSPICGRTHQLERAVTNLLDNALKFSPPGGEVFVGLRDGQIVVGDQGPGIADEDLPHVFERFYRAPGARELPGSGLGLAIVAQAAADHGGSASAERGEGGGTLMRLTVPAQRP
ncbi:MAG TPA: HAMP domain-containing sensor histidine kinase [Mycobacteriales bacterium]|nr:HAMP domain-containing sensor histidine kinase [Mycobacteriales bacterium]